jgi:hypothetical protein
MSAIDALHADDPATETIDGEEVPKELLYARRMSAALERLVPGASDALRLAVRAQHLVRWRIPRADYPDGKAGYHAWRTEEKRMHATLAADALRSAGVDEATVARVGELVQKKRLATDPEAQALEDAACLVFLEHELTAFARDREHAQIVDILQKTWKKMSENGRALALALDLPPSSRALIAEALRPDS